jgi:hypothetical protein
VTIPAAGGISIATGSPDRIGADFSNNAISTLNFGGPNNGEGNFQLQYDRTGGTFRILGGATGSQTERLRIDASGNVGIGTSDPSAKIDLRAGTLRLSTNNDRTTVYGINRGDTGSTNGMASIGMFGSGANGYQGNIIFSTSGSDVFNASLTERMRIDASGNVGIGGTANAAAILDAASTTKGFLPPRMTTAERDAISSPPAGLVLYNTSTNKLQVRTNTAWADLH